MKTSRSMMTAAGARLKLAVRGAVQGVGFRPFVFKLATGLGLQGWVQNSPQGVVIEAEGGRTALTSFLLQIESKKPPRSFIQSLEPTWLDMAGYEGFAIRTSESAGAKTAFVLPDSATCPDCLREILDPANRRHRYPFTNCTNCGPRFSIIEALPYDRANTSMNQFEMCPDCRAEYQDPLNRRFHAQPNACPVCGPHLELWSPDGEAVLGGHKALLAAARAIVRGRIVAIKGIGGFHLMVDARNEAAVGRLRERKHREEKPLALMFPSLKSVKAVCEVSPLEERLLRSPEAPIVLLRRQPSSILHPPSALAHSVAPGNPNLGVMLPSNPLHHLLMAELGFPIIATSGNLTDEPICIDEHEALERLGGIADVFLVHNRRIVRHVDDSIARVMLDREMVLRRARGYAPLPVQVRIAERGLRNERAGEVETNSARRTPHSEIILAVGAHMKNSVALAVGENVFISQHIGDLETEQANSAFRRVISDFEKLYEARPEIIAADLHPDYLSTKFARESGNRVVGVQHHVAHVLSCLAENEIAPPALGVSWDGTGCGLDGAIWGGEFFLVTDQQVERVAHLRPFRLPGGDKAVKEPRRAALGLLYELYGEAVFEMNHLPPLREMPPIEMVTLKGMLQRRLNSPSTSSMGRLFDAVASLVNLRHRMGFEGQPAMELEFALGGVATDACYTLPLITRHPAPVLDWSLMILSILADANSGVPVAEISAKFHNALVEGIVRIAKHAGQPRVLLSGGCFQNRYLTERTVRRLREEHFQPYWHQRVPANDGGIVLGQIVAARRELAQRRAAFKQSKNEPLSIPNNSPTTTLKRDEARAPLRQPAHPPSLRTGAASHASC
ncbi:MAG: carbamoyltransferase HypF [Verrucomicrobiales bacterium]|nr:carbamoyltransferase HypF [Verrucomicrobiales bacterium]